MLERMSIPVAVALVGLCWAGGAAAQPDPFADYEAGNVVEDPSSLPDAAEAAPTPTEQDDEIAPPPRNDAPPRDDSLATEAGDWLVGGRLLFSYSSTKNDTIGAGSESDAVLFSRVAPVVGWFPVERLELNGSLGLLSRSLARTDTKTATENDWVLEVGVRYAAPITDRFAIIPGLGLGAYFGRSERELTATEAGQTREFTEKTKARGGLLGIYLGVGYQLAEHWQIRSGLVFNGLLGTERVESLDESLATRSAHVGLPIEIYYTFP